MHRSWRPPTDARSTWLGRGKHSALPNPPCQVEPVSRRSANAAYVLWTAAFNVLVMMAGCALGFLSPGVGPPLRLVAAVDRNLMLTFLVANVLTGCV